MGMAKSRRPEEDSGVRTRARILVVDDDPVSRVTLAALLADDFEVVTASSARAAIEILDRRPIDVLCTDYEMPDMNGAQLLDLVFSRFPCVAGVVVTGHREFLSTRPAGHEPRRVFDIILKPFDPDQLLRTLARALDRTRVARELERRAAASR